MTNSPPNPFPPTLTTPRLTLELHSKTSTEQYQSLINCLNTPNALKFIGLDKINLSFDIDKLFSGTQIEWKFLPGHEGREGLIPWDCIYHVRPTPGNPGADTFVGFVLLVQRNDGVPPDEGWLLRDEYNGYGYATEAAKGVLDFATEVLGIKEVIAWPKERNVGSVRVAERIGLVRVGEVMDRKSGEVRVVFGREGMRWPGVEGMLIPLGREEIQRGVPMWEENR